MDSPDKTEQIDIVRLLHGKSILVVDDEEMNWLLYKYTLEETNVHLIWARTGQDAIDIMKSENSVDLILMDMKMPILDGFNTTQQIREINTKVPIIAQTAYAMPKEIKKCFDAGCSDHISKPINFDELYRLFSKHFC